MPSALNLALLKLVLNLLLILLRQVSLLTTRSPLPRVWTATLLLLHLLRTLLITLLRTLLTAMTLVARLHLLIITVTRTPSVRTARKRLLTFSALGTRDVRWTTLGSLPNGPNPV